MSKTVADRVVEHLIDWGIQHIFGFGRGWVHTRLTFDLRSADRQTRGELLVLQMAHEEAPTRPGDALPESRYTTLERTPPIPATIIGAGLAAGWALRWALPRH